MTRAATAAPRRETPSADVFARTVPLVVERHYFGEHKKASLSAVEISDLPADEQQRVKSNLALTKRLVNMPETAAIRQHDVRFRLMLGNVAIPFRSGIWLTPVGMVERTDEAAQAWLRERDRLADAAALAYPAQVARMREPLGPLFNPLDYPRVEQFRSAFWADYRFVDFGVPNVLREVRAEVFQREREKLERAGERARGAIEQHLYGSLLRITDALVGTLQPRANGRFPALREGALDKLLQFLETAELRNVTNAAGLRQVTARLRRLSQGLDVEALRDDEALRVRVAESMAQAREALEGMVTDETRRAIHLRDDDEEVA